MFPPLTFLFLIIYETSPYVSPLISTTLILPMILRQNQFSLVTKLQATQSYIVQLTDSKKLNLINNPLVTNNIFIRQLISNIQGGQISDFSLNQRPYQSMAALISDTTFTALKLSDSSSIITLTSLPQSQQGLKIKIIDRLIAILTKSKKIQFYFLDSNNPSTPYYTWSIDSNFDSNTLNFTFCKKSNNNHSFIFWDSYGRMLFGTYVFDPNVQVNNKWVSVRKIQALVNDIAYVNWKTYMVNVDSTCNYVVYEKDTKESIKIFDFGLNKIYDTKILPTQKVYRVQFYADKPSQLMVYYQNNTIIFYQFYRKQTVYKGSLQPFYGLSEFSMYLQEFKQIILPKSQIIYSDVTQCNNLISLFNIQFYCEEKPVTDPNNPNTATMVPPCSTCPFQTYQCIPSINICNMQVPPQSTDSLQGKSSFYIFTVKLLGIQQSFYQAFIQKNEQIIRTAIYTPFMLSQTLPLASFLIGFLNYWSICSLYVLVEISKPQVLSSILKLIYEAVNYSAFSLLDISTQISTGQKNYFQNTYLQQYEISSIFLEMHLEDFVKFFLSVFILLLMYYIKSSLDKGTWLYKKLNSNYTILFFSQYVSFMTAFFLPSRIIPKFFYSRQLDERINNVLHLFFIGFSLILPFIIKSMAKVIIKKSDNFSKISYKIKDQQDYIELYYCSLCSSVFPFVIIGGQIYIIFIVGLYIFVKGINYARNQTQFRINKIILNLHPLFFHISFTFMYIFSQTQAYQCFGFLCIVFLIIGAVHQLLNLIFQIFYPLIRKCIPRSNVKDSTKINKNKKQQLGSKKQVKKILQFFIILHNQQGNKNMIDVQENTHEPKILKNGKGRRQNNQKLNNYNVNRLKVNYNINKKSLSNQILSCYQSKNISSHSKSNRPKHQQQSQKKQKLFQSQIKKWRKINRIIKMRSSKRKQSGEFNMIDKVNKQQRPKNVQIYANKTPSMSKLRKVQNIHPKVANVELISEYNGKSCLNILKQ